VTTDLALAGAVAMVFTFTASSLAPIVVLAIWWRGLTVHGAITGMLIGATLSLTALIVGQFLDHDGLTTTMLQYPALWTVPVGFAIAMLASALGSQRPPANTDAVLARLHLPEPIQAAVTETHRANCPCYDSRLRCYRAFMTDSKSPFDEPDFLQLPPGLEVRHFSGAVTDLIQQLAPFLADEGVDIEHLDEADP